MRYTIWGICFCLFTLSVQAKQVALIIDDIGNHERDLSLVNLHGQITFSILPHTPYAQKFARKAHYYEQEILLHIPMQAVSGNRLGPGGLTLEMEKWQLQNTLSKALASLPQVIGVNNHMGSALTQNAEQMQWTMELLKQRNLFFLDSRTTVNSKAQDMANLVGVKNTARHVFLDDSSDYHDMKKQWERAKLLSQSQPYVVIIAHPYPETIDFLTSELSALLLEGIELVKLSELIELKYQRLAQLGQQTQY